MSQQVPGTSLTEEQMNALPYAVSPPPKASESATLLARKYLDAHPEPAQDPALRTGSHADRHVEHVAAALRTVPGFVEAYPGEAAALARRHVPLGMPQADVRQTIAAIVAGRAAAPRKGTRSAENVLRKRV